MWGGHENKVEKEVGPRKAGSVYTRLCAYQIMVLSVLVCILKSTSSQATYVVKSQVGLCLPDTETTIAMQCVDWSIRGHMYNTFLHMIHMSKTIATYSSLPHPPPLLGGHYSQQAIFLYLGNHNSLDMKVLHAHCKL